MLNKKEFKELLIEWKNFINERGQYSSNFKKDIPCHLIGIERNKILSLIKKLYNKNVSNVKKSIDNHNSHYGGIAIEKSKDVIEEIFEHIYKPEDSSDESDSSYSLWSEIERIFNDVPSASSDEYLDSSLVSQKEELKNSETPLIIFPALGNQKGVKDEKDEYAWITHDLEHALFGLGTRMVFNKEIEDRIKSSYPDQASWVRLINGATEDYTRGPDGKRPSINVENIFFKFFNDPKISFTKGVGSSDVQASIWAYCISRMENKLDLSSVDNSSLDKEEKKIVKGVLLSSHDIIMRDLKIILKNINNQVIIIKNFA